MVVVWSVAWPSQEKFSAADIFQFRCQVQDFCPQFDGVGSTTIEGHLFAFSRKLAMPLSDFGIAERTQGRSLPYSRRPIIAVGRALLTAALGAAKECHGNRSYEFRPW